MSAAEHAGARRCSARAAWRCCGGAPRNGSAGFDAVVLACHSDQALSLLGSEATADERAVLGAIRYQPNQAVLHTDVTAAAAPPAGLGSLELRDAGGHPARAPSGVCLHYWLNRLQPLPWQQPVAGVAEPGAGPDAGQVHVPASTTPSGLRPRRPCRRRAACPPNCRASAAAPGSAAPGAGYGFHEDGLKAGLNAARTKCSSQLGESHGAVSARRGPALTAAHPGSPRIGSTAPTALGRGRGAPHAAAAGHAHAFRYGDLVPAAAAAQPARRGA